MIKHKNKADIRVFCNVCGKEIERKGDILIEDFVHISKEWGYFSDFDLEVHQFNICESCYNELVSKFKIPVEVSRVKEVL